MTAVNYSLRKAFAKPLTCFVRVTPQGFLLVPHGVPLPQETVGHLVGRITKVQLTRKRFDENIPVCQSKDGQTAENGTSCAACQHPACRPWLRVRLAQSRRNCIFELNITSANNLFVIEDQAEAQGQRLKDWTLRLTVENHEHWAEVRFARVTSHQARPETQLALPAPALSGKTEAGPAEEQPAEG